MEAFSSLIAKVGEGGFVTSFKVVGRSGERVHVSHLLFANGTLFFCEDNDGHMKFWKWIVTCFKLVSGSENKHAKK